MPPDLLAHPGTPRSAAAGVTGRRRRTASTRERDTSGPCVGRHHRYPAGATLLRQGEPGSSLHLILQGRVRVQRIDEDGESVLLAEIGDGEVVGEMSVLDGSPRTATVIALEDTITLELGPDALRLAMRHDREVAVALLRMVVHRLRSTVAVHGACSSVTRHQVEAECTRLSEAMVASTAHELRTPLTVILGFSEMLLRQTGPDDPRRAYLAAVQSEAARLAELADHLLGAATPREVRTIEPGWVRVAGLARPLLETVGSSSPRHRLHAVLDPALPVLWADAARLQQILSHLLSNAVKYSPAGGAVTLTVERLPDGGARLAVEDPGVGIPPEHQDRIFERFQRVDARETQGIRGTGLGLYIVKHLVELHGGTISVRSTPGQGSTFTVILPPPPPDAPPLPAA